MFTAVSCMLLNIYKSWHDLEFQDLISAVMIVNASSAMIRMTLSRKEILAACVLIIVIRCFFFKDIHTRRDRFHDSVYNL
jgi:hypothetical protein